MSKSTEFYNKLRTSKLSIAACPITGIIITLDIPVIPNLILDYEVTNPLSQMDNVTKLFASSYKELSVLPTSIMAGCLLTVLNHNELIQDSLSSIERNRILSEASPYSLYSTIKFFTSASYRRISLFPRISLESSDVEYSSCTEVLENYMECCSQYHVPAPTFELVSSTITKRIKEKRVEINHKRLKNLLNIIIKEEILKVKTTTFLKAVIQGDNILTMDKELRDKMLFKLAEYNNDSIDEFVEELESYCIIEVEQVSLNTTEISDSLPSIKPKKSLMEILAERKGN